MNIKLLISPTNSRFVWGFDDNLAFSFIKSFSFLECFDFLIGGAVIKKEDFMLAVLGDVGFGSCLGFQNSDIAASLQAQLGLDVYIAKRLKYLGVYADVKLLRVTQLIINSDSKFQKGFVIKPSVGIAIFPRN